MCSHIQKRPFFSHTTSTTTTYNYSVAPAAFTPSGGVNLSSDARVMMRMMRLTNSLNNGGFGHLMNFLDPFGGGCRLRAGDPGFGRTPSAVDPSNASQAARGQARELKAGETVRGANGSLVKWGRDGNVDISYRDQNGQTKNINVKDGMIRFDGGEPRKLENVGQLLKLPNGDVVGIGNNPGASGQKLCRVVMADNPDQIKCEPASATNIYDVRELEHRQTGYQGGGVSLNYSQGVGCGPWGLYNYAGASISVFRGIPVTRSWTEQIMSLIGSK